MTRARLPVPYLRCDVVITTFFWFARVLCVCCAQVGCIDPWLLGQMGSPGDLPTCPLCKAVPIGESARRPSTSATRPGARSSSDEGAASAAVAATPAATPAGSQERSEALRVAVDA